MKPRRLDSVIVSKRKQSRRGAAFLMFVVLIALVVVGATHSLVRNEVESRRGTQVWIRSQIMQRAIQRSGGFEVASEKPWALPLGEDDDEYLQVNQNDVSREIVVRWIRHGAVIDEMSRQIAPAPTESENIE